MSTNPFAMLACPSKASSSKHVRLSAQARTYQNAWLFGALQGQTLLAPLGLRALPIAHCAWCRNDQKKVNNKVKKKREIKRRRI